MARTRRAVSPTKRAAPIDVTALRERVKAIETRVSYSVPITVKIEARMYEALVEACDKYEVRFADMVRRAIAEGLTHMTEFVTPYEQPFEQMEYKPGRGASRGRTAYEEIVGQRAPALGQSESLADDDPLVTAAMSVGMRPGMPRRAPAARAAAAAVAMDRDDDAPKDEEPS